MTRLPELARPAEDFVVIHATPEMNVEAASLLSWASLKLPRFIVVTEVTMWWRD
jgi:hypothetical protein